MQLQTVNQHITDFIDNFCYQLEALVPHDFINKEQSTFAKELLTNVDDVEIVANLDFSENYTFILQNEVQSAYYNRNQCTIHPIVYHFKEDGVTKTKTVMCIAESTEHTTEAVHLFQKKFVAHLNQQFKDKPKKKIKWLSDGAGAHYKNKKNMLNLCLFEKDFSMETEWQFFCDGARQKCM